MATWAAIWSCGFVDAQGLRNVRALIEIIGVDGLDLLHPGFGELLQQIFDDLVIGRREDLTCFLVHDTVSEDLAQKEILGNGMLVQSCLLHLAHVLHRDALVLGHDQLALLGYDVEARNLATQPLGNEVELNTGLLTQVKVSNS